MTLIVSSPFVHSFFSHSGSLFSPCGIRGRYSHLLGDPRFRPLQKEATMLHLTTLLAQASSAPGSDSVKKSDAADMASGGEAVLVTVKEFLATKGIELGINLIAAVAIFIVGRWVTKLVLRLLGKVMTRSKVDETLIRFVNNLSYSLLMVIVVIAALNRLGVDTTSISAMIAAAGLAIGFALQGSLANFAAGVLLIIFKPFKVGNFIEAAGTAGVVEEIQIFNTMLRTGDNVQVIVPNKEVTGGTIKNFSAKETRRIDLVFGCGYDDNLREVKQYLEEVVTSDERILPDPAPVVAVHELGDNSVNLVVRPWVKSADYWQTRWDLIERIKLDFDEKGFNIPYPQRDVHLHNES